MRIARSALAARPTRFAHRAGIGRDGLNERAARLHAELWPIAQVALAAGLAWLIATRLLSGRAPIFAPITAMVALGVTLGQRGRRAVEYVLGVSLGVAVADLIVRAIGNGTWQMMVIVLAAMAAAALLSGGRIFVVQAGVSAVLVVALQAPTSSSYSLNRFLQALIGGGVALLFSQLLFPLDPVATARRAAAGVVEDLAATLRQTRRALEDHDLRCAEAAMRSARGLLGRTLELREALATADEAVRFAPRRRRHRGLVGRYRRAALAIDLAAHDAGGLVTAASRVIRGDQRVHRGAAAAVGELAEAAAALVAELSGRERGRCRELALDAARRATASLAEQGGFGASALVSQVRSTALDLLRATGMDAEAAREELRRTYDAAGAREPLSAG